MNHEQATLLMAEVVGQVSHEAWWRYVKWDEQHSHDAGRHKSPEYQLARWEWACDDPDWAAAMAARALS